MQDQNRLAKEKSPYLLQHQHNPVDWFPWGEEAFGKARDEAKPIFLSIGYSTCHWCHVMERESFEDETVARFLNRHFISIKVDREERPDLDKIYMTAVQALSGQGGWPLSAFLTPELKPFYGGTYFPPRDVQGRPGFLNLLQGLVNLWQTKRDEVMGSSEDLHQRLAELCARPPEKGAPLTPTTLEKAAALFQRDYDPVHGGFGRAPKFPRPAQPGFLLRFGVRHQKDELIEMVAHTCKRMARGGMNDQLGGGFARYSVDGQWRVPHFEKMLYDNAQLAILYLDTFLVTGDPLFSKVVETTLDYVRRDMTHPEGGFYSAEDADSEGKEGKFYCWTLAELRTRLSESELDVFARYYGVTEKGNFVDHSDPDPLLNQNVLNVSHSLSIEEMKVLNRASEKAFLFREQRVRPHLDDKVLASWNGLMLGAMARAYGVLGRIEDLHSAERCFGFLHRRLWDPHSKQLFHRWRDGESDRVQLQQAYAFLMSGLIDLYEVSLKPEYLSFAVELADAMILRFYDHEHGGFWQCDSQGSERILSLKEDYDGAEPSGNSVAMLVLQKLEAITGRSDYSQSVAACFEAFAERLDQRPQAVPMMLLALDFRLDPPKRVVIQGRPGSEASDALVRAVHSVYQPNKVVMGTAGAVDPFVSNLAERDGGTRAFLCSGDACHGATDSTQEIIQFLQS